MSQTEMTKDFPLNRWGEWNWILKYLVCKKIKNILYTNDDNILRTKNLSSRASPISKIQPESAIRSCLTVPGTLMNFQDVSFKQNTILQRAHSEFIYCWLRGKSATYWILTSVFTAPAGSFPGSLPPTHQHILLPAELDIIRLWGGLKFTCKCAHITLYNLRKTHEF